VYAWDEFYTPAGKGGQRLECALRWTSAPKDPASFKGTPCRKEPFFKKSRELQDQWPGGVVLKTGDRALSLDLSEVHWPPRDHPVPPAPAELRGGAVVTAIEGDDLLIYPVKSCNVDQPAPGCERTRVSVLRPVEGQMTFIGKLEGERLTRWEGKLHGAAGDRDQLVEAFAFETGFEGLRIWLVRGGCIVGIWMGLAALKGSTMRLLRALPWLLRVGPRVLVPGISVALGLAAYNLRVLAPLLGTAVVVALFLVSRGEAESEGRG
jgi:hypothetical protein